VILLTILALLLVLGGLGTVWFLVIKKKLEIPGLSTIRGFINPNYQSLAEDSNVVSLRDLSSKQK